MNHEQIYTQLPQENISKSPERKEELTPVIEPVVQKPVEVADDSLKAKEEQLKKDEIALRKVRESLGITKPEDSDTQDIGVDTASERIEEEEQEDYEKILEWYKKAKEKADRFIAEIDPDYSVEIVNTDSRSDNGTNVENSISLYFNHTKNSKLSWTMSIRMNDDYLNNRFEDVVKNIYNKRIHSEKENIANDAEDHEDADDDFGYQELPEIEGKEKSKGEAELRIIELANMITDRLRSKFGLKNVPVPDRAIHIIREADWSSKGTASYIEELRAILVKEPEKLQIFKKKVIHEMLHLKSLNILPVVLNEALVEQITIESMKLISDDPYTSTECSQSEYLQEKYKDHRTENGEPLFDEETFLAYVGKDRKLHAESFTYKKERRLLDGIIDNIYKKSGGMFASRDEVFGLFVSASFTGNTKPLEIIDQIYGSGTFEKLKQTKDVDGVEKVLGI